MANYSQNTLTVRSNEKKISQREFIEFQHVNIIHDENTDATGLSFKGLLPMPKDYAPSDKEFKKHGGRNTPVEYIWNCEHWGCKNDCITNRITKSENELIIMYETPWLIGEDWLNEIAAVYSNLEFEFSCFEESGEYEAIGFVKNGTWQWEIYEPARWRDE